MRLLGPAGGPGSRERTLSTANLWTSRSTLSVLSWTTQRLHRLQSSATSWGPRVQSDTWLVGTFYLKTAAGSILEYMYYSSSPHFHLFFPLQHIFPFIKNRYFPSCNIFWLQLPLPPLLPGPTTPLIRTYLLPFCLSSEKKKAVNGK